MKLQEHLVEIQAHRTKVLAIHCEGSRRGTKEFSDKRKFGFPLANDDRLNVVDKYSVTSTYLIDSKGIVQARWLDRVHDRVDGATILKALAEINPGEK